MPDSEGKAFCDLQGDDATDEDAGTPPSPDEEVRCAEEAGRDGEDADTPEEEGCCVLEEVDTLVGAS